MMFNSNTWSCKEKRMLRWKSDSYYSHVISWSVDTRCQGWLRNVRGTGYNYLALGSTEPSTFDVEHKFVCKNLL